jgi:hypothetical protein
MATKTKVAEATARALNTTGVQRIAKIWSDGDSEIAQSGGALARKIAEEACRVMPKEAQPIKADASAVVALVAKHRKWNKASLGVRESQCMAILAARATLPRVVPKIVEKYGACRFLDAYYAASAITKGKDPMRAVGDKRKAHDGGPQDAGAAKKRAAILLKKAAALPHLPRDWKAAIRNACDELSVR